jgi:TonB family protein
LSKAKTRYKQVAPWAAVCSIKHGELFAPCALAPNSGLDRLYEGENVTRLHPYRKICGLLAMFSCMSAGYAQDAARKIVKKVPVQYPLVLKMKGIGGTVRLKVFIKPDGSVRDTEVLGGSAILAESAQKSVGQWKFSPGNSETIMEISVVFDPAAKSEN